MLRVCEADASDGLTHLGLIAQSISFNFLNAIISVLMV